MLGSTCLFGTMGALVKWSGSHLPIFEITFWRALIGLVPVAVALAIRGVPPIPKNPRLLLLRCTAGTLSMLGHFYGIVSLSLSDAVLLGSTAPVFVALVGPLVLGERTSRGTWLAIVVCIAGIAMVLRPGLDVLHLGALAALGSGALRAAAYLSIGRLSSMDEDADVIAFWFPLTAAVVNGALMLPTFHWPGADLWPGLLGLGLMGGLGQLLMTRAYAAGPAAPVAAASYCAVVVSWVYAIAVFGERILPTSVAGGVLVVAAGAWLAATTRRAGAH